MSTEVTLNPAIFRAYDIRGVAARDLTPPAVAAIARAFADQLVEAGAETVAVGRDVRASSPAIAEAVMAALVDAGLEVRDLGEVPTPLVYFAVYHYGLGGGVMITASHNPAPDNGLKMLIGTEARSGEAIQDLLQRARTAVHPQRPGGRVVDFDVVGPYLDRLCGDARLGSRPLKVAVDGGNGMSGPLITALLDRLGVEHVDLYCDPDGRFPNHHPDPTVAKNLVDLQRLVREEGCDLGVAFDGDGDRIGVVDEAGRILHGDRVLLIYARALLAEVPGAKVVGEVKCSDVLFQMVEAWGGRPILARVGHSFMKALLKAENAEIAGEMSGHMFFNHRFYGFDDAVYAALRLLEVASTVPAGEPFSSLLADVPEPVSTPEIRVECPDDIKFAVVAEVAAAFRDTHDVNELDGARIRFEEGWGLVRASNTQPSLVTRFEAADEAALADYQRRVGEVVDAAIAGAIAKVAS